MSDVASLAKRIKAGGRETVGTARTGRLKVDLIVMSGWLDDFHPFTEQGAKTRP
jgi:hypothetical protein